MRISINLATQPFEDRRSAVVRWSAIAVAMLLLTVGLMIWTVHTWHDRRTLDRQLADINGKRQNIALEKQQKEAVLNQPQNRGTRDRAQFLNELIARKQFSWTAVFSELEHILPNAVRIVAIKPDLNENNQLSVQLNVQSDNRGQAIEFIQRIEDTKQFRNAHLIREQHGSNQPNTNPNEITYEIGADYIPQPQSGAVR
ncbi:MAG TPA: hypothetical protein VGC88_07410 [Terriglobales bacterium]